MSRIALGNVTNSLDSFKDEYYEAHPGIQIRRYLAYGKITNVPQLVVPLFIPSRQSEVDDIPLVIGDIDHYYRFNVTLPDHSAPAGSNFKLSSALATDGIRIGPVGSTGYDYIIHPPSSPTLATGAAPATALPLSIYVTTSTHTVAAATGIQLPADSTKTEDYIAVAICVWRYGNDFVTAEEVRKGL